MVSREDERGGLHSNGSGEARRVRVPLSRLRGRSVDFDGMQDPRLTCSRSVEGFTLSDPAAS
jgi:hypothetical protein